jgi:hypothetical protein
MSKQAVDFSTPISELLGGGGSIFIAGPYRVEVCDFRMYDFKKPGNDALCLYMNLQPLDADGNDEGEAVERYWPLNEKTRDGKIMVEAITPVKGRKGAWSQIRFTEDNQHGKIYAKSDFGYFLEHCAKAEVDMDAVGNDITAFESQTFEFGLFNKPATAKTAVEEAEGDGDDKKPNYPKQTVIITGTVEKKGKKTAAKGKSAKDDDEDEKPAKKSGAKAKKPAGPEALVLEYLESEVCTEDNESEGVGHLDHKLALSKWLAKEKGLDPDDVKAAMKVYNDVEDGLPALLTTLGWSYNKKTKEITKDE